MGSVSERIIYLVKIKLYFINTKERRITQMDSLNDLIWTDEDVENSIETCAANGAMVQICMAASCVDSNPNPITPSVEYYYGNKC